MNRVEYRWMRNPTPVTTRIMTTESASRVKEMLGENPPAGGAWMNEMLAAAAATKDRPTDPAPTAADTLRGNLPPKIASTRNPAKGSAGRHQVQVNISGSLPGHSW